MKIYACLALTVVVGSYMFASDGEKKSKKRRPVGDPIVVQRNQRATRNTGMRQELMDTGISSPNAASSSIATTSEVSKINVTSINHPATPMSTPTATSDANTTRVVKVSSSSSDVLPSDKEWIRIKIKNMCAHAIKVRIIGDGMQQISVDTGDKNRHHQVDIPWHYATAWQPITHKKSVLVELPTFARITGPENIKWVRYSYTDGNLLIRSLNNKKMRSEVHNFKKKITITAIDSEAPSHLVKCNTMKDTEGKLSFQVVSDEH